MTGNWHLSKCSVNLLKDWTSKITEKEETLYQKRFEEVYDVPDPKYEAWVSLNHPASCTKSSHVSPIANLESLLESNILDVFFVTLAFKYVFNS